MPFNQLPQWDAHRLFDIAWGVHMAGETIDLRAGVSWPADAGKPGGAAPQDRRYDRNCLDIVDSCRAAVEADLGRERWFEPRLPLAPFEAFEQSRLLAADIGASAAMQVDIERPAGAARILADQTCLVGFVDRRLQTLCLIRELTANIDVAGVHPHPDRGEQTALHQLLGVVTKDITVLAGPRLALIGIDAEVSRAVALLRHKGPLQPGRKTRAAATAQPGFLDLFDDPVASLEDQLLRSIPIAASPGTRELPIVEAIQIGENPVLVGKHPLPLIPDPRRAPPEWCDRSPAPNHADR